MNTCSFVGQLLRAVRRHKRREMDITQISKSYSAIKKLPQVYVLALSTVEFYVLALPTIEFYVLALPTVEL
jgi:hypothetical protein